MFSKILVANRGEIAVRIIRTCREMGIKTVAVYSEADSEALHVRLADESFPLGPSEATQSYLNMERTLEIAERSGAEAVHPGYGFLAENPDFVEMCADKGVVFIGPPGGCMYKAKPKHKARQLMKLIHMPVVPGSDEAIEGLGRAALGHAQEVAESIGYPVIVKPTGTGGGIGMMVAKDRSALLQAVRYAQEMGRRAFGISGFYIEKLLTGIKHIEIQVLADTKGNVVYLGERDCSVQRRFQKMVEEGPCPILTSLQRMRMGVAAIDIARALRYVNALTVEFFYYPEAQEFYFNEVNCRLQLEHCVTEILTGVDLVKEQIRIAAGEQISLDQDHVHARGHAIECRVNAEDPARNFMPSPGTISRLQLPHGFGVRVEEGVFEGYEVPFYYDSLLFKLITWGNTRDEAIRRMRRSLAETVVEGIKTNIPFQKAAIEDEQFQSGLYTTSFLEERRIAEKLAG